MASDGWNPLHLAYKYYHEGNIDLAGDIIENFSKSLCKNLSSKEIASLVKTDIKQFCGSVRQHDDQTVLIIKIQ